MTVMQILWQPLWWAVLGVLYLAVSTGTGVLHGIGSGDKNRLAKFAGIEICNYKQNGIKN